MGKTHILPNFMSTSRIRAKGEGFALMDGFGEENLLLIEYKMENETGKYYFSLD